MQSTTKNILLDLLTRLYSKAHIEVRNFAALRIVIHNHLTDCNYNIFVYKIDLLRHL